jgi:hypothetical protein
MKKSNLKRGYFVLFYPLIAFLLSSCDTVVIEKPVINQINADKINLSRYYYQIDGSDITLIEVVDLSKYNYEAGHLYTVISPTDKSGENSYFRFVKRIKENQYVCQSVGKDGDKEEILLYITEQLNNGDLLFYDLNVDKLNNQIKSSSALNGLVSHITYNEGSSITFDSVICTNNRNNILSFFRNIDEGLIKEDSKDVLVFKKCDEELYNYFLKKFIENKSSDYIQRVEKN